MLFFLPDLGSQVAVAESRAASWADAGLERLAALPESLPLLWVHMGAGPGGGTSTGAGLSRTSPTAGSGVPRLGRHFDPEGYPSLASTNTAAIALRPADHATLRNVSR